MPRIHYQHHTQDFPAPSTQMQKSHPSPRVINMFKVEKSTVFFFDISTFTGRWPVDTSLLESICLCYLLRVTSLASSPEEWNEWSPFGHFHELPHFILILSSLSSWETRKALWQVRGRDGVWLEVLAPSKTPALSSYHADFHGYCVVL